MTMRWKGARCVPKAWATARLTAFMQNIFSVASCEKFSGNKSNALTNEWSGISVSRDGTVFHFRLGLAGVDTMSTFVVTTPTEAR